MMNKPYFTRKNLIFISLAIFYSFLLLFTGLCIEGSHSFANKNNPLAQVAQALHFKSIIFGVTGYVALILVAIYVSVFVTIFLYEKRFAIVNNKKPFSLKMILIYISSFILCALLSVGVGILIQRPLDAENIGNIMLFIWQTILLTTCIYVLLFLFIGGMLMFVVNYILVDKPFRAYDKNEPITFDEEDTKIDVTTNFDATLNATASSIAGGQITTATSSMPNESIVRTVEKLDDREKVFPALSMMDTTYDGYAIEKIDSDTYSLEEISIRFRNYLAKEEKLYFDLDTIRFFVSGFAASHFMILEGLSGTGKSSLPRYFAKFIHADVLFIPVQATYRDKTNLIGYFNDFSKTYTETEFLISLYHANYNPDQIHFFVLDEMNISRVEYYFADFLSVLEYPKELWKLKIMQLPYGFVPPAKLEDGFITIPENSYFVGTANKDDSTFTITDKVYDRAITIDFDDRNIPFEVKEEVSKIHISKTHLQHLYQEALNNPSYQMTKGDYDKFQTVCDFIYDKFDITFGNRILNQIAKLVPVFVASGGTKEDAIDFIVSRKIISKIEGRFEEYVKGALKDLLTLITKTYGIDVLYRSEKVIQSLIRRL